MVTTFQLTDGTIRLIRQSDSMAAASAQLPQGSYTTFRTYAGTRVLHLERHIRRLLDSAALLGAAGSLDMGSVSSALAQAIRQMDYSESRFRLTFSPPHCYISIESFTPYPAAYYEAGVRCVTVAQHRDNPHAKSTAFIAPAGDAYKTLPAGVHEGLMVSADGCVLEGLSSNFFALLHSVLHTEQEKALQGITQELALEVAQRVAPNISQSPHAIRVIDLPMVDECFITSVSREVMPVVQIDDVTIGDGKPGRLTRSLIDALAELIKREAIAVVT